MKKLLYFILLLSMPAAAQQPDSDGNLVFKRVDSNYSSEKDQLYTFSKQWLVTNFNSAKDVIQTDDKAAGVIMGTFEFTVKEKLGDVFVPYIYSGILEIDIKDHKTRVIVSQLQFQSVIGETPSAKQYLKEVYLRRQAAGMPMDDGTLFRNMKPHLQELMASYITYVSQKDKNKDW